MVKDQSQPALLSKSSTTPRVAAALAEAQKREKYLDKATNLNYDLIPATFEEAGAFSPSTLNLVYDCSRAAFRSGRMHDKGAPWPANAFAGYSGWTQRLSVALRTYRYEGLLPNAGEYPALGSLPPINVTACLCVTDLC